MQTIIIMPLPTDKGFLQLFIGVVHYSEKTLALLLMMLLSVWLLTRYSRRTVPITTGSLKLLEMMQSHPPFVPMTVNTQQSC